MTVGLTEREGHSGRSRLGGLAVGFFAGVLLVSLVGCRPVPQVLVDDAVFGELDALYTAVTTQRRDLLDACRQRLTKLHDEQRLPDAGFAEISGIIQVAERGDWPDATQRLYAFMRAQRKPQK